MNVSDFAQGLAESLPDPVDREALLVALATLTASVIGTLIPKKHQARYVEAFASSVRSAVESGDVQ